VRAILSVSMDPVGVPTSFIPKRPVSSEPVITHTRNRVVGLFTVLTVIIVIATIIAGAGVFLYERQLASQKIRLNQSISAARDGLGTEFVSDMKRLSARIEGVKSLLKTHIVVSPIFAALQDTTLRSIQYRTFGYEFTTDSGTKAQMVQVSLTGSAKNYATLALQSDAFSQNKLIKNPIFSNLTVDDKTGRVGFKLTFTVNPSDLSYQAFVDSLGNKQETTLQSVVGESL
jgi:hypothetical protein